MLRYLSKFLLLLTILFFTQTGLCNRPIGGQITYRHLGNNKYYVEIIVNRDCRYNGLSGLTFGWFAGNGNNTTCGMGALNNFKRVKITDITVVHPNLKQPCSPANTPSSQGIEAHTYVDTLDFSKTPFSSVFSNKSCTELSIYVNYCCRMSYYSNLQILSDDFLLTTTLYIRNLEKCANNINNTPQFSRNHPGVGHCNNPVYWSLGTVDSTDRDSLIFKLAAPLGGLVSKPVTYKIPHTVQYPVYCKCINPSRIDCAPSLNTTPVRGTYFDPMTGDLIYSPAKCDAIEGLGFEINEYRRDTTGNMLLIARSIRESINFVQDSRNMAPKIKGDFSIIVTKGDTIRSYFNIEDDFDSIYLKIPDTIQANWTGGSSEPIWKFTRDSMFPNKGRIDFTWITNAAEYSEFPYLFTIAVTDNQYPIPIISMRTLSVKIQPEDTATISIENNMSCAGAKLSANIKRGDKTKANFQWIVRDSATRKIIMMNSLSEFSMQYLKKGTYAVELIVKHPKFGYKTVKANFSITADMPRVQLGQDVEICTGQPANITSNIHNLKTPIRYSWEVEGKQITDSSAQLLLTKVDSSIKIIIQAKDSLGCIATDTMGIATLPLPTISLTVSPLPVQCWSPTPLLLNNFIALPNANQILKYNFRITGNLTQYGSKGLVDSNGAQQYYLNFNKVDNAVELQNGKEISELLTIWYKDSLGCENNISAPISIKGRPIIEIMDKTICQIDDNGVALDSLILKPAVAADTGRKWSLVNGPKTDSLFKRDLKGNVIFKPGKTPDNSYSGEYHLQYCVTNSTSGCKSCDSNTVVVLPHQEIQPLNYVATCQGASAINLSKYFLVNGLESDSTNSTYTIVSRNGDKDTNNWDGAHLTNGYIIPSSFPVGKWAVAFIAEPNPNFCNEYIENVFEILPKPKANFTTIPEDSVGKDIPIFKTKNSSNINGNGSLSYLWYVNHPYLDNYSIEINPDIHYLPLDANYTVWLIATSTNGCSDTAVKTLKVGSPAASASDLEVDGIRINLKFQVSGFEYRSIHTQIFDAAGKSVADNTSNDAIELSTGIYYYQIRLEKPNGETLNLQGKRFVP